MSFKFCGSVVWLFLSRLRHEIPFPDSCRVGSTDVGRHHAPFGRCARLSKCPPAFPAPCVVDITVGICNTPHGSRKPPPTPPAEGTCTDQSLLRVRQMETNPDKIGYSALHRPSKENESTTTQKEYNLLSRILPGVLGKYVLSYTQKGYFSASPAFCFRFFCCFCPRFYFLRRTKMYWRNGKRWTSRGMPSLERCTRTRKTGTKRNFFFCAKRRPAV